MQHLATLDVDANTIKVDDTLRHSTGCRMVVNMVARQGGGKVLLLDNGDTMTLPMGRVLTVQRAVGR